METMRKALLALAVAATLLLPLIVLNVARFGTLRLERFREPTLAVYLCLGLYALLRRERGAFLHRWFDRLIALAGHPRFFPVMSSVMLVLYLLASLTRHLSFHTFSHDFSMVDEALHSSCRGRFLFSPILGGSFLGEHFSPALAFLVPLHCLWPSPYLLILVQPLALWAGVLILRKILAREGASPALAGLAGLVYLNHPLMISTLNYLFHVECLLPVAVLGMVLCLRRRWCWGYWGAMLLALSIKEDVGIYLFGFALYLAVAERRYRLGLATAVVAGLWVLGALELVIPHFAGTAEPYKFLGRWSRWGGTPAGILAGFLSHPRALVMALLAPPCLGFFLSLLFLPFASRWGWLLLLPPWVITATSTHPQQAELGIYYGLPLFTFAVLASVVGLRSPTFLRLVRWKGAPALALLVLVLNVAHLTFPAIPRQRWEFLRALDGLPAGAPVQAMSCFYPVLGYERLRSLLVPGARLEADYLILRTEETTWPFTPEEARRLAGEALGSRAYEKMYASDSFFILRRRVLEGDRGERPVLQARRPAGSRR